MNRQRWLVPLLLAVAVAFFGKLAPSPDGFLYRPNSKFSDLTITHWPNALYIRQALAEYGQVPLWRSLILGGEPFAANPLSGLWYPPFWLLLVLPLTPAFNLLFVLHMTWAGWGGYRLARLTGASPWGGLLAALVVMLAPKAVAHLAAGHVGLYSAWAWLPWVFWAVRRLAERGRAGDVAAAAATAALMILADVRLGFYGGLAAAGYWLARGKGRGVKRWLTGLSAVLLAAALVAVQFLPLAAVAGRMNRGGLSLAESGIASLPPRYLLGLLVADHGGFQEWMTYLGAVGLLLALVGLARWRARERWLWGGMALAAAVYSLGVYTPLYPLLYRLLSPLSWLRGPARAWFLVVLATAVLAAQGLTALERVKRGARARFGALALAVAAVIGAIAGAAMRLPANVVIAATVWPLAGALALLAGQPARGSKMSWALRAALVLLALVDLGLVGSTLYRVRPAAEVLTEGAAAARWLAAQERPFRVYSPSYSIPQHTGAVYGIETVDGVDPFQLADYAAFMRQATGVDIPGYSVTIPSFPAVEADEDMLLAHRDVQPDLERLGLLNVRYLAAAFPMETEELALEGVFDGVYLYRNGRARPRAWVEGQTAAVHVLLWSPNRIEVEAIGAGLLVLSEVYDPDWRATVDGQAVEIVCVDGILRGVPLDTGRHHVILTYWPAGLSVGLTLSALGWLAVVGLACRLRDESARV